MTVLSLPAGGDLSVTADPFPMVYCASTGCGELLRLPESAFAFCLLPFEAALNLASAHSSHVVLYSGERWLLVVTADTLYLVTAAGLTTVDRRSHFVYCSHAVADARKLLSERGIAGVEYPGLLVATISEVHYLFMEEVE